MIEVKRIENKPVSSCCYIVFDRSKSNNCLIIDPGSKDSSDLIQYLITNLLYPDYIILTHEHFDHCWSVNSLLEKFSKTKLICSEACMISISDSKLNYSLYYEDGESFVINTKRTLWINKFEWNDYIIELKATPGHTLSSVSIIIDSYIFTGDAYIPGQRTVTNLRGDKQQAKESEEKIKDLVAEKNLIICPGHGGLTYP